MKIVNQNPLFTQEQIEKIEQHYNAKFVCETSLKVQGGGWSNFPVAVFYTETAHPEGSNWFGLYWNHENQLRITDAKPALEPFDGLLLEDGSVFYSRYRHDYQSLEDGTMVDGGREYIRYNPGKGKVVRLQIVKDQLEIVE
jgi:hypothetical protein